MGQKGAWWRADWLGQDLWCMVGVVAHRRSGPKDPNTFLPLSPSQKIWLRPEKLKANWVLGFLMLL